MWCSLGLLLSLPVAAQTKGGLGLLDRGRKGRLSNDWRTKVRRRERGCRRILVSCLVRVSRAETRSLAVELPILAQMVTTRTMTIALSMWDMVSIYARTWSTEISLVVLRRNLRHGGRQERGADLEGSGIGWHVLAGPMISLNAGTLPINLSVFYSYTSIGTVDGGEGGSKEG